MDRTSWIGVLACLGLLFAWGFWNTKEAAKRAAEASKTAAAEEANKPKVSQTPAPKTTKEPTVTEKSSTGSVGVATHVIENNLVRFIFTNQGAGLSTAELKEYPKNVGVDDLVSINAVGKAAVGALSTGHDAFDTTNWEVKSATATTISYETVTPEGFALSKTFTLADEETDPHKVKLSLTIKNAAETPLVLEGKYFYLGSASPLHLNEWSMQIGMFWMNNDGDFEYKTVDHYGGRKVLGIFGKNEIPSDSFALDSLKWAGVNDQFFTTVAIPEAPYPAQLWGSRIAVIVEDDAEASAKKRMAAAEGAIGLPKLTMNPGDQQTLNYDIYLGPKEYSRITGLGDGYVDVMHYDEIPIFGWMFGWAIKPLASWLIQGLVFLEGYVQSYGIAIILITILIRLLIWPVYAKSARSMKRMSKLTPMMKELRKKHEDDPQKLNEETMKLYRTYNINPLGGCLPMFIQLPVFLAFYRMLWSAVELRGESFMWVDDLALPDTLFVIPGIGIPFNLLPILMGITSFIQIAITPKTGDKTQQMIFMLMPIIFLVICYNFAAALALYWTVSNAFSILQTWLMNKLPEPELKKREGGGKKSFMQRMQEQAEAAQKAKASGGGVTGKSRTAMPGEKGARHTRGKKKRR
jgi:YidC/Oxa1 family membrane protein insertase